MSDPIANFELSKMKHREHEEQASKSWERNVPKDDKPTLSQRYRIALALTGVALTTLLIIQILAF